MRMIGTGIVGCISEQTCTLRGARGTCIIIGTYAQMAAVRAASYAIRRSLHAEVASPSQ